MYAVHWLSSLCKMPQHCLLLNGKWTASMSRFSNQWPLEALNNILTFTYSCTHTDVNHARRHPARREQWWWGVLLRDTSTLGGGVRDRTSNLPVTSWPVTFSAPCCPMSSIAVHCIICSPVCGLSQRGEIIHKDLSSDFGHPQVHDGVRLSQLSPTLEYTGPCNVLGKGKNIDTAIYCALLRATQESIDCRQISIYFFFFFEFL